MHRKVNRRMKVERAKLGATQAAVAEAIGISTEAYVSYENGRVNIPLSKAIKIANYFGVSLDYLFQNNEERIS